MKFFKNLFAQIVAKKVSAQSDLSMVEVLDIFYYSSFKKSNFDSAIVKCRAKRLNLSNESYKKLFTEKVSNSIIYLNDYILDENHNNKLSKDKFEYYKNLNHKGVLKFDLKALNLSVDEYNELVTTNNKKMNSLNCLTDEQNKYKSLSLEEYGKSFLTLSDAEITFFKEKMLPLLVKKNKLGKLNESTLNNLCLEDILTERYFNDMISIGNYLIEVFNYKEFTLLPRDSKLTILISKDFSTSNVKLNIHNKITFLNGIKEIPELYICNDFCGESLVIPPSVECFDYKNVLKGNKNLIKNIFISPGVKKCVFPNLKDLTVYCDLDSDGSVYVEKYNFEDRFTSYIDVYYDFKFVPLHLINNEIKNCFFVDNNKICYLISDAYTEDDIKNIFSLDICKYILSSGIIFENDDFTENIQRKITISLIDDTYKCHLKETKNVHILDSHTSKTKYIGGDILLNSGKQITLKSDNAIITTDIGDEIYDYAYYNCKVDTIVIAKNIKHIGNNAFANSDAKNLIIEGNTTIEANAFDKCNFDLLIINGDVKFKYIRNNINHNSMFGDLITHSNYLPKSNLLIIGKSVSSIEDTKFNANEVYFLGNTRCDNVSMYWNCTLIDLSQFDNANIAALYKTYYKGNVIVPAWISFKNYSDFCKGTGSLLLFDSNSEGNKEFCLEDCGVIDFPITSKLNNAELIIPNCVVGITDVFFQQLNFKVSSLVLPKNIFKMPKSFYEIKLNKLKCSKEIAKCIDPLNIKYIETYEDESEDYKETLFINSIDDFKNIPRNDRFHAKTVVIGAGIEEIPDYSLQCMFSLENFYCKGLIKRVGKRAFACCVNLKNISLSETLSEIDEEAFAYCIRLSNITGFNSLRKVKNDAFLSCKQLRKLVFSPSIEEIYDCINGCDSLIELVIPSDCNLINLTITNKDKLDIYLPQKINNVDIKFKYDSLCNVYLKRGSSIKKKNGANFIYMSKSDFDKEILNILKENFGTFVFLQSNDRFSNNAVHNDSNVSNLFMDSINYDANLKSRASFQVSSKTYKKEDFNTDYYDIDDVVNSCNKNNPLIEGFIKVDRLSSLGNYEVKVSDFKLDFNSSTQITNNVFTINIEIISDVKNPLFITFIDDNGGNITEIYQISNVKKKYDDITFTLQHNTPNGKYYFVVSSSNPIENNVIYRKEVNVKIAFALDDDFDL